MCIVSGVSISVVSGVNGVLERCSVFGEVLVTWKVSRSLVGLSLMSSIGLLLMITSVISPLGTNTGLREGDVKG